jgi:hypothetical protein
MKTRLFIWIGIAVVTSLVSCLHKRTFYAHERLAEYHAGKVNWFGAVGQIVRSTNGVENLIQELSCGQKEHQALAQMILEQIHSPFYVQITNKPSGPVAWQRWWTEQGKTNTVPQLWHHFDSHYK